LRRTYAELADAIARLTRLEERPRPLAEQRLAPAEVADQAEVSCAVIGRRSKRLGHPRSWMTA